MQLRAATPLKSRHRKWSSIPPELRKRIPRQLRAFQRVHLKAGQTKVVRLPLAPADLKRWDVTRSRWVVESSVYDVLIGSSSSDIRQKVAWNVHGETIPARDLSRTTRAENFDGYADGVKLVDESKATGTSVGPAKAGDWIVFKDANLRNGSTFTANVAALANTTVQVRLDSPTGKLLGTAQVTATGDVYKYAATTATLAKASGRHDVYLVFGDALRVSTFSIR